MEKTKPQALSDHKSSEVLRNELAAKVGECEKFRDALVTHLRGLYEQNISDDKTRPVKDYIIDLEIKAIHPVNTILRSPELCRHHEKQFPEFVQILNAWLVEIERRFGIRWQDRPSAEVIVLPQKPPART